MINGLIKKKTKDHKIVNRLFRNIALVAIATNLVNAITTFTDGICASHITDIGNQASAGLSIVNPSILFTNIFVVLLEIGCQILCSRCLAKGDRKKANQIYSLGIVLALGIGVISTIVHFFLAEQIVNISGGSLAKVDEITHQCAIDYMQSLYFYAPFILLFSMLMQLVNLEGDKLINYLAIGAVLVVNVVGDVVGMRIFKNNWAIGVATALSYLAGVIVLAFHFRKKKSSFHFSFRSIHFAYLKDLIVTGGPNCAKVGFIFARNIILNNLLALYGGVAFVALSAQSRVTAFVECIAGGLISACLMLSSIFYGEEDRDALNSLVKVLFKWVIFICLPLSIVYFFLAEPLAIAYGVSGETELIQATYALRADALTIPFIAINAPFLAIFQGTKRTGYSYLVTALQSFVFPSLFVFVATRIFPEDLTWVWFAITDGFIFYTFLHFAFAWIRSRHIGIDVNTLFFLPKNFGYKKEDSLRIVVNNITDALEVTHQVVKFCEDHKIDDRRKNHLAACAEELALMTVMSGFTRDRKKHTCEMRVLYKRKNLTLRLRDDCAAFNLKEKFERIEEGEDPTKNVAIRLVMGLAKDVQYVNLLKTNNLIVKV